MNRSLPIFFSALTTSFILASLIPLDTKQAYAVDLKANFRLFGEVRRVNSLGFGDMFVSFGINQTGSALTGSEIGRMEYPSGNGAPFTTGVLEPLILPTSGFGVVDFEFSVPFTLEEDQEASMFIGLGTNLIGSATGASGSIRLIFDFSDNISFVGSLLGSTLDQGLSLTSVTLADGTLLSEVGLEFEIIPENTILSAFASAADDAGQIAPLVDTAMGTENRAAVFPFTGTANSKLQGGFNTGGVPTDALVNLDVNPEPNPLVFDLAGASIGGTNNIRLVRLEEKTKVPESTSFLGFLGIGILGVGSTLNRKTKCDR